MIDDGGEPQPVNTRIFSDGRTKDFKQGWFNWVVAVGTMTIYTGWMHILILLTLGCFFSRTCLMVWVAIMSTLLLPPKPVLWTAFCQCWAFKTWREYFNFSYLNETLLDNKKTFIFVEFPHGVYPMSELIAGTLCQAIWPSFNIYSVAASSVFSIPFWRHFIAWMGSVPATRGNFKRILKKGSVAVVVGGIAEMYMQHARKERIILKDRKGFVRIAVEEGIDGGVVPVYHFGNTKVFDFVPQALQQRSRRLRSALGFLVGRWGLPVPRQVDLYMVSGPPVRVKQLPRDHPDFEAEVDRVHGLVLSSLQELYDRHKASYGWADRPLSIE
ncbi:MAG: diacylglycerol acyltransferase-domain-containing protein [Monoraphidium minutum]|nr:MAG: diacylglycerol acyltransferase-domain-containing protein [Monoraphidium minutum]